MMITTLLHSRLRPGMVTSLRRAEMVSRSGSSGRVSMKSTIRWMRLSTQPPKYPEIAPMRAPVVWLINVTTNATVREIRAACISRERTSRPSSSVPSQWAGDGPAFFKFRFWA